MGVISPARKTRGPVPMATRAPCPIISAEPPAESAVNNSSSTQWGWVKTNRDQRMYRNMHRCTRPSADCYPATPPIDLAEEARVNELRRKMLIGKTINGTFFKAKSNKHGLNQWHWIRWNTNQADNVRIPDWLAREAFKGEPQDGVRVRCLCTGIGPDEATAWKKRPFCDIFEIVGNCLVPPMRATLSRTPSYTGTIQRMNGWGRGSQTSASQSSDYKCPSLCSESGSSIWGSRRATNRSNMTMSSIPSRLSTKTMGSPRSSSPFKVIPHSEKNNVYVKKRYLHADLGAWRTRSSSELTNDSSSSMSSMESISELFESTPVWE